MTDGRDPAEGHSVETGTDTVRAWTTDGGVGVIELARPERRNALHEDMYWALPQLIEAYEADDAVRCILVTAQGSAFCAGGDVQAGADRARRGDERYPEGADRPDPAAGPDEPGPEDPQRANPLLHMARMVLMLHESPKISIAALPGPAAGAGIGVALAADLRIAATSAKLVPGFARLGFSGDFGSTWFLTRMMGPARALATLVDDAPITAAEALEMGLYNRVVPDDELRAEAMAWATRIASGPGAAFRLMKENVRDAQQLPLREALPLESERMRASGETEDHREAVRRWLREARAKRGG